MPVPIPPLPLTDPNMPVTQVQLKQFYDLFSRTIDDVRRSYIPLPAAGVNAVPGYIYNATIIDSDGKYNRIQIGQLVAYTDPNGVASPAGYGIRVLDANGNILLDSIGISQSDSVIASVASAAWSAATRNGSTTGTSPITGSGGEVQIDAVTFTLSRKMHIELDGLVTAGGYVSAGVFGLVAPTYVRIDGQANSAGGSHINAGVQAAAPYITSVPLKQILFLPSGTYTARIWWNSINGANDRLDLYAYALYVKQMGG